MIARALGYRGKPQLVAQPAGEQRRSILDGSRARRDFDLPPYTPLETGIPATAEWFRKKAAGKS